MKHDNVMRAKYGLPEEVVVLGTQPSAVALKEASHYDR
jgi:hypothetical protein